MKFQYNFHVSDECVTDSDVRSGINYPLYSVRWLWQGEFMPFLSDAALHESGEIPGADFLP